MSSASTWVWSRWQNNSWLGFTYLSVEHRLVHGPFSRPLRYCRYKKKCDLFICYNTTSREIIITVWVWGFCSSTSCATMVPPLPLSSFQMAKSKIAHCNSAIPPPTAISKSHTRFPSLVVYYINFLSLSHTD